MAYRRRMSRKGSRKSFSRSADRIQSINLSTSPMRGGYRF